MPKETKSTESMKVLASIMMDESIDPQWRITAAQQLHYMEERDRDDPGSLFDPEDPEEPKEALKELSDRVEKLEEILGHLLEDT